MCRPRFQSWSQTRQIVAAAAAAAVRVRVVSILRVLYVSAVVRLILHPSFVTFPVPLVAALVPILHAAPVLVQDANVTLIARSLHLPLDHNSVMHPGSSSTPLRQCPA
jgi:hypothetical protein